MSAWLALSLATLTLWGLWAFFAKLATNHLSPQSALFYQILGILMAGLILWSSLGFKPQFHAAGAGFAIAAGIVLIIGELLFYLAITKAKASLVVTVTALYPIVTIILSFLILKEIITIRQAIAIGLALTALVLL